MEAELKPALTPAGNPETDKETAELKPPLTVVEIVVVPELPWVTDKLAGEALTACVRPYKSSSVRRTLKWLMVSVNCPCFTIGPTKIVGIWLPLALSSSSQVTISKLL